MPTTYRQPQAMQRSAHNARAGSVMRKARERRHWTQGYLAYLLSERLGVGVSATSMSYYETGSATVPAAVLLAVLELTDTSLPRPARSAVSV